MTRGSITTTAGAIERRDIISERAVQGLQQNFQGELLRPGDDGYDTARRIWNGMIDRRPALIARCAGPADVINGVRFARGHDLPLAVRSGGHNVAGTALCDDGIVLDLSRMRGIRVDPLKRTVRVQAGVTNGDLDRETQVFGLAVTSGIASTTGLAGLTLGGGVGWLMRRFGLTCDNLRSADVVTTEGRLITASPTEHEDLFWAIRGGGGNFGIVTEFEYALHPLGPAVVAGLVLHPAERASEVLRYYRDFVQAAPDSLGAIANLRFAPPAPWIPRELHGTPVVALMVCYAGVLRGADRRSLARPGSAEAVRAASRRHHRAEAVRAPSAHVRRDRAAGVARLLEVPVLERPYGRRDRCADGPRLA